MDKLFFSNALTEIWKCVSRLNKYIDETAPWVLAKDEDMRSRLAAVMYTLLEGIRNIAVLIEPFMPRTPGKIFAQLGIEPGSDITKWESTYRWGGYRSGTAVVKGEPLYPRIDVKKELEELAALEKPETKKKEKDDNKEGAGLITIEDFAKVQLKVAKVLTCEHVEGADKLLKMILSLGNEETRQVVSGIAKHYAPEEMIGKKVILVSNLKPAVLRGIESQGMILAASRGKKLSLVTVDGDIPEGTAIS